MPGQNLIRMFLAQASATGSKSTVLKPLYIMMAMCIASVFSAIYYAAPVWITYFFSFFTAATMCLYLSAYIYCLFTNPDSLRSETYSIQKLAIEKGFVGDDLNGMFRLAKTEEDEVKVVSAEVEK